MKRLLLLLLMFCLLLLSCAPVRPNLGPAVSSDFANDLLQAWNEKSAHNLSIKGLAKVEVRAPLNDVNGTQVILAEMPDRLRAETLTPFGVPMLTLAVSGDQLGVHLPAQNLYYLGTASPDNLGKFVNIPLDPADLVSIMLYQPSLINALKEEAFALTDGGWLLVRTGAKQRQELVFNEDRNLVEVAYFSGHELKVKVNYSRLDLQGRLYPSQIKLELPEKYATINLEFTDYEINGEIRAGLFNLEPSPGAKVVYLPN